MYKKVMSIGVLDVPGSTNVPQAKAFLRANWYVIPINYRTIVHKYGMHHLSALIEYTVKTHKPDLALFNKCNGIDPGLVSLCNQYTKTWLWNPDPVQTISQLPEVVEHARRATYCSSTSPTVAKWFEEQGVRKCHWVLEGLDYDVLHPTTPNPKYKAQISHIGTKSPDRDMYLKALQEAGIDVKFYGPEYSGASVVDKEFATVCASSKFMLSLNTWNNVPDYFSDRIIRFLGCKACTFHLDTTGTLEKYFKHMKEIIYFKDVDDLLQKMTTIDTKTAKKIAMTGYKKVMQNYTWDNTIQKMLRILNV